MNILFINPATLTKTDQSAYLEQRDSVGHGYLVRPTIGFVQPMGILELASYVRSKIDDISIQLIDFGVELFLLSKHQDRPRMTVEYFSSSIIDRQKDIPDVVGISILFSTSYNSSMMIAELAKKKWPHAVVVIGGVAATHSYKKILTNQVVDYVIRGEAEIAFTQLVQSINSDHNNIVDIDGVIDQTKLSTGSSRMASMVDNLDDIPIPAYDLLDMDLYVKEDRVAMMFSRGCPFKCTFCASPSVHGHGIRERSNEKIKGEIAYLIDHWGIKSLTVYDDLIAANRKKFLELSNYLKQLDLSFKMPSALSVAVMTEPLIDALCDIKLNVFQFAIESGSSYTQKHLINKRVNLDKARSLIDYAKAKDQSVFVNVILGIPHETKELMAETINYCKSIDSDWIYFFSAIPLPGTAMYEQFRNMGKIDEVNDDWDKLEFGRRTFDTAEILGKELEELVYDSNIEVNFFNNQNIKNRRYERAIRTFNQIVINPYPYHIVGRYCRGLAKVGLKLNEDATTDFETCARWVESGDAEAVWMYERYGESMPLLGSIVRGEKLNLETIS